MPAGRKLLALLVGEVIVAAAARSVAAATVAVVVAAALWSLARVPVRTAWRSLRLILLVATLVGAAQWWYAGGAPAFVVTSQLVVAVAIAVLVTLTTRTSDLLDALDRGLKPLRHLGVDPARVSLTLALAVTSVPVVGGLLGELRQAARARGIRPGPVVLGVPLVVRTLQHADQLGEALAARGVDD
nr:CbiQ family ECF transporter T component [Knoellia sp. DB2414S]